MTMTWKTRYNAPPLDTYSILSAKTKYESVAYFRLQNDCHNLSSVKDKDAYSG